jgi:hypothetical protein
MIFSEQHLRHHSLTGLETQLQELLTDIGQVCLMLDHNHFLGGASDPILIMKSLNQIYLTSDHSQIPTSQ